jgi:hypothetical protein
MRLFGRLVISPGANVWFALHAAYAVGGYAPATRSAILYGAKRSVGQMRIKKQTERWFDIPNDPDEGSILIKHLSPGEISDIMDGVFKQTIRYPEGSDLPEFTQETDKRKDREESLVARVKGWKKFYDQHGRVLVYSQENVIRASREIEGFNLLVTDFANRLAEDIAKETEQEDKDLEKN